MGEAVSIEAGRGALEPSLACFKGKYHLTIRAEDSRGYHAVSDDGLAWCGLTPWRWDDGEALEMSTTQQHWLSLEDSLYLFYTRRHESNEDVFRWRAPIFMAEVDTVKGCLIRRSEEIVFPLMRKDGCPNWMGNFHVAVTGPGEALVSDAPVVDESRERL